MNPEPTDDGCFVHWRRYFVAGCRLRRNVAHKGERREWIPDARDGLDSATCAELATRYENCMLAWASAKEKEKESPGERRWKSYAEMRSEIG